ncbi:MAG: hypothetical protein E7613_06655 [Ruminococcaceae bacterium]|nr:hypothetical protein [Oscillospiraceae bacterium]
MKRFLAIILLLIMCMQCMPAMADTLLIAPNPNATPLPFKDVAKDAWYYSDVKSAYNMGLINGKGATDTYQPDAEMTYAEAIKLAACMHQLYTAGEVTLANGTTNWYDTYVEYCKTNSIISKDYDFNAKATRAGYMEIFANALPDEALAQMNIVPNNFIPDIKMTNEAAPAVYKLYRAGILAGVDAEHNCSPKSNIKRSEVAVILSRMMVREKRVSVGFEMEKENELTFGIFADVHNNKNDFANVMDNVYTLSNEGSELDGLILVGDIVYLATKDSMPSASTYAMINANPKFAEVKRSGKLIYAMGNHEFPLNNTAKDVCDLSKKVFTDETGLTPEKVTVIDGYHFITAGPNSYSNDLTAEQEKFIMDSVKAALAADDTKPVFLIIHQPVDSTTYGTYSYKNYSDTLEAFLKAEPRLIVFSGHMHYPSSDPQTIFQVPGGATFVQTTSIMGGNGARTPYVPTSDRHANWPCQAMMMRINKETNVVTLKRFYSCSGIPEYLEGGDWTLDIPAMTEEKGIEKPNLDIYKYTTARADSSKAPFFKEDDKISITEITETTAKVVFPVPQPGADGEDHVAAYYKIEVVNTKSGEVIKSAKRLSDYFLKTKKATYSYPLIDLPADTTFKVTVTPVNPWYVEGKPLTTEFSTPEPKFAPVKTDDEKALRFVYAEAQRNGGFTNYPQGAAIPEFAHMGATNVGTLKYLVEITTPGKYRVFFNGGAAGAAEVKVTIASVDVTEKEDGSEKVTTKETLYEDTFIVSTGELNARKPIPCADIEFKEAGYYTIRFRKNQTPYTISHSGMNIAPIIE